MAVADLLTTLTASLTSATTSFPQPTTTPETALPLLLLPPTDGISLLDTKNDLLLSYLQNLVFLILLKLREAGSNGGVTGDTQAEKLGDEAVKKLVETRVYLEKGVRPLEGRLRYQIEKVLRAVGDVEQVGSRARRQVRGKERGEKGGEDGEVGDGTESGDRDSETSNSDSDSEETSNGGEAQVKKIDDLSYRPNPSALLLRKPEPQSSTSRIRTGTSGTYKPPRITPTSMPEHSSSTNTQTTTSRPRKSHLLDEYISTELSSAPHAEPSIGSNSTILARGRGALSTRERERERERTEYEERNFSRLPKESKAERRKKGGRDRGRDDRFGGEDWAGLGEVGDRVARSVGKGGSKGGVLERREKRRREGTDVGSGGVGIGEAFEKRRKILEGRAERKRKVR